MNESEYQECLRAWASETDAERSADAAELLAPIDVARHVIALSSDLQEARAERDRWKAAHDADRAVRVRERDEAREQLAQVRRENERLATKSGAFDKLASERGQLVRDLDSCRGDYSGVHARSNGRFCRLIDEALGLAPTAQSAPSRAAVQDAISAVIEEMYAQIRAGQDEAECKEGIAALGRLRLKLRAQSAPSEAGDKR